ncbi:TPA: hypothetical protein ACX6R5_000173 [Photobacterium damselae]
MSTIPMIVEIRIMLSAMKITLTPQQKLQLEQMHDIKRDSRVCDRIKAVLLTSEGWSQTMISQSLVFMNQPLHATSTIWLKTPPALPSAL